MTAQAISTHPRPSATDTGQPRSAKPFAAPGGSISFPAPLAMSAKTGNALTMRPIQTIVFDLVPDCGFAMAILCKVEVSPNSCQFNYDLEQTLFRVGCSSGLHARQAL